MKKLFAIMLAAAVAFGLIGCTTPAVSTAASTQPTATAAPSASPSAAATVSAQPSASASASAAATQATAKDYGQLGSDLMKAEALGQVRLNMTESQVLAALGQPDEESEAEVWGSDGLKHADWSYSKLGLSIDLVESTNKESEFVSYFISAEAPCTLATLKGVKIGDKKDAVMAAYADTIDPQSGVTEDSIVAGSTFGGITFTIKDGLVTSIFIGAAAE